MKLRAIDFERRTAADAVFDRLHADIVALKLEPGAKISEVEIATSLNVSRQPVREAFRRLGALGLLEIRPQKATIIRKISKRDIYNSRFIRAAIEIEVLRQICQGSFAVDADRFDQNLRNQKMAVDSADTAGFHALDYEFHRIICETADLGFAYEEIHKNKAHVDRLCMVGLTDQRHMARLLNDHERIYAAIRNRDETDAVAALRSHLACLDDAVAAASVAHAEYFD